MSDEIKNVLAGEYCNPVLDGFVETALYAAMITLDTSAFMNIRVLRTHAITDDYYKNEYISTEESGLSL